MLFFKTYYSSKNPEKMSTLSTITVFKIDKKSFLSIKSSILELSRITMKTGVMAAENSALHHRNKLHIKIVEFF